MNEVIYSGSLVVNNPNNSVPQNLAFETLFGNCTSGLTAQGSNTIGSASAALNQPVNPHFGAFINNDSICSVVLIDHSQPGNPTVGSIGPGQAQVGPLWPTIVLYAYGTPSATTNTLEYLISGP